MKTRPSLVSIFALSLLLTGCNGLWDYTRIIRSIKASDTVVGETREVSGFTGVDLRTVGRVILTQGESESLSIRGSDNVVPLVKTSVQNGALIIEMEENYSVAEMDSSNVLTFTIGVKDLTSLTVSGAGDVEMDGLAASRLTLALSGAGRVDMSKLDIEDLRLAFRGAGDVTLSGQAASAAILISGVGSLNAARLEIQTADITLQGLGNATLWVTGKLTGTISGAGNVEYYGETETDVNTTGVGRLKSLGAK
jgi:hypothetical protein